MENDETSAELIGAMQRHGYGNEPIWFRMPLCTWAAAAMYLQVWIGVVVSEGLIKDLVIRLALNNFERDKNGDEVSGVDDDFAGYINRGQFPFQRRKWGRVTFVRKDGAAAWPVRYALQPTFHAEDLVSDDAVERRLAEIEERKQLDKKYHKRVGTIDLRWSLVEKAMETRKRVDDRSLTGETAHLYQAFAGDEGTEMWVARFPIEESSWPDRNHFIRAIPNRGVAVRLTARFLTNLITVVPAVIEDGIDWASAYYLRRVEESAQDEPDKDEEASDEEDSDD